MSFAEADTHTDTFAAAGKKKRSRAASAGPRCCRTQAAIAALQHQSRAC